MKMLSLEKTPKRVELLQRMGSSNRAISEQAQEAFAAFVGQIVQTVLLQKVTSNAIYTTLEFNENDRPTIPIELYAGTSENYIRVWSQRDAGGLGTNEVVGLGEYTFNVFPLDSAISFRKSYLKHARLDVLTAGIERMINEIAVKQELNAWIPILKAAATATTNGSSHIIGATKAGRFLPNDLNKLWTKIGRMYTSYTGGTPASVTPTGLTDMFISLEIMENIRAFAYNPVNTMGGLKSDGTESGDGNITLPEATRSQIYNSGGLASMYGVNFHTLNEFGKGQKFNVLFDNAYQGSFDPDTQDLALGLDLSRPVFLRPVVLNDDGNGGQVLVRPDNQWVDRSEHVGMYARVTEGRLVTDDRAIVGITV